MKSLVRSLLAISLLLPSFAWAGAVITFHGRILDHADQPLISSTVLFRVRIYSPNPSKCLLYEEERTIDMSKSDGIFVIPIGDGKGLRGNDDPGITIEKIFANNGEKILNLNCNSGTSYTPQELDHRQMLVSYDDHTGYGWDHLPLMDINYVPLAVTSLDSQKVGGVSANSVLKVVDPLDPTAVFEAEPLTPGLFTKLLEILNGTSTQYEKSGQLNGSALPTLGDGQVLGWSNNAWTALSPQTGSISITADAPLSVDNSSSSPKLSLAKASSSTSGYLDKADFLAFSQKLDAVAGSTLPSAQIWVGNSSNNATAVSVSGDISLSNTGVTSVTKIRGQSVSATAPSQAGQVLTWDSSSWTPQYIRMQDIRNTWGGTQMIPETPCTNSESMVWSAVNDRFTCQTIKNIAATNITGLADVAKSGDYNDLLNKPTKATWETKTANFTASSNGKYFVDVSAGPILMSLPATANVGDEIEVLDVAGGFNVNALSVARNGHVIMGLAEDMTVDQANISFTLIYSGATHGWRIK